MTAAETSVRVDAFMRGDDRSLGAANIIEVALDETFGDHEPYASAVAVLASYRPGGGAMLYDEHAAVAALARCQNALAWIARFEALLPSLEDIATEVRRRPLVRVVAVNGRYVGGSDAYGVDIDCLLNDVPGDQPDNVALSINVYQLSTSPQLTCADVCWGHPSGQIETERFEEHVQLTDDVLACVRAKLPELGAALLRAVERGVPLP